MAQKKKRRGHYCRICNTVMSNERFSGKGHANHICKKCSKLSVEERNEMQALNKIYGLYRYTLLSKPNRKILENYSNHNSEKIRRAAKEVLDDFITQMMVWKMDEEYENLMDLDSLKDEFLDDEDDEYIESLTMLDGEGCFDEKDDDELPF